jgi:hypothetical protein
MNLDKSMTRVFICGPMSGFPQFNYPAFDRTEFLYKIRGYKVENPAKNFPISEPFILLPWHEYLRVSIRQLTYCDRIYKLPGWWKSKGALLESLIAFCLGIRRIK